MGSREYIERRERMGSREHKKHAPDRIGFAVVTVSDTRTPETDTSGSLIRDLITEAGYQVVEHGIIRDDAAEIERQVDGLLDNDLVDVIVLTGGTGVSRRDVTPEAVAPLLEKDLPGFGEVFRTLSMEEIGSAAIMSRATAGIARKRVVFCIPGSRGAVSLAMSRIILEEAGHILWEVRK
jgi:molybdenum cofactor biosynthesis protein B